ncbi:Component of the NOP7 complex, partial [Teratosphaeria destructans]
WRGRRRASALDGLRDTKAVGLLERRVSELRQHLRETATRCWNALIRVDLEEKSVTVHPDGVPSNIGDASMDHLIDFDVLVRATTALDVFDELVKKLGKDIERAVLRPRLNLDDRGHVASVVVNEQTLSCTRRVDDPGTGSDFFADLQQIIDFLSTNLPPSVGIPLSKTLIPTLSTRLVEQWFEPAVPTDIDDMPAFQELLRNITSLANGIDRPKWHGSKQLRDWVANAPRTWLTKRREAVLGDARNLVFTGLRETKVVERVETQMISKDDHQALQGGDGADDEGWDAWDEPEEPKPADAVPPPAPPATDEDDGDAWGAWDAEDSTAQEEKPAPAEPEDEDAWGAWRDDDQPSQSPTSPRKPPPAPTSSSRNVNGDPPSNPPQREMTLRESFTITAIPDALLTILQTTIADAQTLSGPAYASSPIAPAATALYTLPTLALAIYRATAPTAYTKLPAGNMLIYNDALRLADQLRSWQASQPLTSRLRLDNDVTALETFAKRAYSSEMDAQRTILRDLLDTAQGFTAVTKPPFKQAAESAIADVVARLHDVHALWRPLLPPSVLLQALGSLLSTLLSQITREIQDLGDISEDDSHQLRALMDSVSTCKSLFTTPPGEAGGAGDMTFIYCPTWLRFQYLAEILESSLADIRFMWVESELSLEFAADEVVELVQGLFADSELRRRTVAEIRRGGGR